MHKNYRKAVSVLVVHPLAHDVDNASFEFLLVHKPRFHDAWQLPQGGIEKDETVEQAALRELREETSIVFDAITHLCATVYSYDFPPSFLAAHQSEYVGQTLAFALIVTDSRPSVKVDGCEVDHFVWITPADIDRYVSRHAYAHVLRQVLQEYVVRYSPKRSNGGGVT